MRFLFALSAATLAYAQLIPPGGTIPRSTKPPVVFLNGYQIDCGGSNFTNTFGIADQVLASNGESSLFFDNCTVPGKPPIETLGAAFGTFLSNLRYADGTPVDQVDVVAHSMGGLIVRSYLSGKQTTPGAFNPPASPHIRKAVFLATPHFGTGVALGVGLDPQLQELGSGSRFLFDLATWNQGADDLHGIDAVAEAGNAGTGLAVMKGFDDGVVSLTSASLGFYLPGRTRVVPYCHTPGGGLISFTGLCSSNAPGVAAIRSADDASARIIVSFFNGTTDWQNIGTAAEQDPFLSIDGGLDVLTRTATDSDVSVDTVTASSSALTKQLNVASHAVAYTDLFPAGVVTLTATAGSTTATRSISLPPSVYDALVVKQGPIVARVFPAASATFPLAIAPGSIVSIYGTALGTTDAQVSVNGTALQIFYASPTQINALLPGGLTGLVQLTVKNSAGSHTVNVLIAPAVPAIFTQNQSGSGAAAALKVDSSLITPSNPLHAGDYVELFATGLGATTNRGGLDYANTQPTVTIGGEDCPVSFAGRAPGFPGLDQINCIVPTGLSTDTAPVVIVSGTRSSNIATVAVH